MNPQKLSHDLETKVGISRAFQLMLAGFMTSTLLLALHVTLHTDRDRVIMMPPQMDKTFWVDREGVSPEMMQDMGIFLVQLAYDVSPSSIEYQSKALLKYATPEAFGALQKAANVAAARMQEDQSTTVFNPRSYVVDQEPDHKAVAFLGELKTYVTDNLVSTRSIAVMVKFKFDNGRLYIAQMKETSQNDPFETKTPGSAL